MVKQEREESSLSVKKNTCFAVWKVPQTWVGSADAGGGRPAAGGIVAAHGRLELLRGVLRSLLNGWSEASTTSGRNGTFGCTADSRRWGRRFVAPWAEQRLPVNFWCFDECVGRLRLVCGLLEKEMADGGFSGREMAKYLLW